MQKYIWVAALVLVAGGAQAATLSVDGGTGQLMGASGVLVDGSLYDVQFLDGSCIALFNGCDEVSDFTFQTEASAISASQALLDQVFIDGPSGEFNTTPALTNGCSGSTPDECFALTPFRISAGTLHDEYSIGIALNTKFTQGTGSEDNISLCDTGSTDCLMAIHFDNPLIQVNGEGTVYAVWSVSGLPKSVPMSSTASSVALLLALGLTGLSWAGRRRSRS